MNIQGFETSTLKQISLLLCLAFQLIATAQQSDNLTSTACAQYFEFDLEKSASVALADHNPRFDLIKVQNLLFQMSKSGLKDSIQATLKKKSGLNKNSKDLLEIVNAKLLWMEGNDKEAEVELRKITNSKTVAKNSKLYGYALYNLGEINYIRHFVKQEEALGESKRYHYKARKLRESIGDTIGLIHSLSRIGILHERADQVDSSLTYYQKAIELSEQFDYKTGLGRPYTHIGIYNISKKDTLNGLSLLRKALEQNGASHNFAEVPFNLVNLVRFGPEYQNDYALAKSQLSEALCISKKIRFKLAELNTLFNLGLLANKHQESEVAKDYFEQVLNEATKHEYKLFAAAAKMSLTALEKPVGE